MINTKTLYYCATCTSEIIATAGTTHAYTTEAGVSGNAEGVVI
jgi:hypothetical protein